METLIEVKSPNEDLKIFSVWIWYTRRILSVYVLDPPKQ
jgi:hypothetical protein